MRGYQYLRKFTTPDFYLLKIMALVFLSTFFINSYSSVAQEKTEDSLKIDSLKKVLPGLEDTARIDCLNTIGKLSMFNLHFDTATRFLQLAYEEAKKLNYINGQAVATSTKAGILAKRDGNFSGSEKLHLQALSLFRKTPNKKGMEFTCWALAWSSHTQSKYDEALKYFDTSYRLSQLAKDTNIMITVLSDMALVQRESGNLKKSFEIVNEVHRILFKSENKKWKAQESALIPPLYENIEEYDTALKYLQAQPRISNVYGSLDLARLFSLTKQFDSATYYYQLVDTTNNPEWTRRMYLASRGQNYLLQKKYDSALSYLLRALNFHRQANDGNQTMRVLVLVGRTYLELRNNDSAYRYAREALNLAQQTGTKLLIRDSYHILYEVYNFWKNKDSALFYHEQYVDIKDSIASDNLSAKLEGYNFNQQIELLDKEKKIQQAELQRQSLVKKVLIVGIIMFLLLSVIIIRNIVLKRRNERLLLEHKLELQKLESERTKTDLEHQATELEMQALRAQMNPHFIFNSLNSINRFILQNNKLQASEYLTKFSRLIRLILQNSQAPLISLESELESLQLYLDLEAARFDHKFDYEIKIAKDLDISVIKVPPLIIQPYAENAIWHGFMPKEDKGHLIIELFEEEDMLYCKITDDGVGRKKASEIKSKSASPHKSVGMRITADRIAILQQKNHSNSYVSISDLVLPNESSAGTEVLLKIPLQ